MPFKVVLRPRAVAPSSRRRLPPRRPRRRFALLAGLVVLPLLASSLALGYYYATFSRLIDARLRGEREHTEPRVYARPFELRRGQAMTRRELVDRLNDLGYAERPRVEGPGEFALDETAVSIMIRGGDLNGQLVRVAVREPSRRDPAGRVVGLERSGGSRVEVVTLEAPLITALHGDGREKRRYKRLDEIPTPVVQAVLAIEDRRFYQHHGIDWLELRKVEKDWERGRPRGGSTITQQLVKNLFFTSHRSPLRKIAEFVLAPPAEWLLSKNRILELYLNQIEWGPGVFGAEAAARYHYGISAGAVDREQAARLAAVIPAPRTRKPQRMHEYSAEILERMSRMGW